jgi:ubiquinone/menaquinone biosynthesis C-methylase UbiE
MTAATGAGLRSFRAVDADPDAVTLVAALDAQAELPAVRRLREAALQMLGARTGQEIVDVGCGTGEFTRTLATAVAPTGRVLGVDASDLMVTEARRRAAAAGQAAVEFRTGDITRLEDEDASWDGAYCERVLQHVAAPARAVAELARITRVGGRLVVVDTDWGMHAINGADRRLTRAIVASWSADAAAGWVGRQLRELLGAAGVEAPTVIAETHVATDAPPDPGTPFPAMAATAVRRGTVSEEESRRWLEQLAQANADGRFLWAVTMFAAGGVVTR